MTPIPRRPWLGYGVAVASVAMTLLCGFMLGEEITSRSPFLIFFPAVMISGWFGGIGPGLVATGISLATSWYLFFLRASAAPRLHLRGCICFAYNPSLCRVTRRASKI